MATVAKPQVSEKTLGKRATPMLYPKVKDSGEDAKGPVATIASDPGTSANILNTTSGMTDHIEYNKEFDHEHWKGNGGEVLVNAEFSHNASVDDVTETDDEDIEELVSESAATRFREEDQADMEQREKLQAEGGVNAMTLPERAIEAVPLDIAELSHPFQKRFSAIWSEGSSQDDLQKDITNVNLKIQKLNVDAGRDKNYFIIQSTRILSHMSALTEDVRNWTSEKSEANAKACAFQLIQIWRTLAQSGLSWKGIVTPATQSQLLEVLNAATPFLGNQLAAKVIDYINEDHKFPTFNQVSLVQGAEEPLRRLLDEAAKGDFELARTTQQQIVDVNSQLAVSNSISGFRSQDHLLPTDLVTTLIKDLESAQPNKRHQLAKKLKIQIGKVLWEDGYHVTATTLATRKQIEACELPKLLTEQIARRQIEYRPIADSSDKVASGRNKAATSAPAASFTAAANHALAKSVSSKSRTASTPSAPESTTAMSAAAPFSGVGPGLTWEDHTRPDNSSPSFMNSKKAAAERPAFEKSALPNMSPAFEDPYLSGVEGPSRPKDGITELGKVVAAQRVGGFGIRVLVNIGTYSTPVYKSFPGEEFGRGMSTDLPDQFPVVVSANIRNRKSGHVNRVLTIYQVGPGTSKRQPITKFLVEWKKGIAGFDDEKEPMWVTRSDLMTICGKPWVERARKILLERWHSKLSELKKAKELGLHPDTKEPLTEDLRPSMPWLFPEATSDNALKTSPKMPAETRYEQHGNTDHIEIGDGSKSPTEVKNDEVDDVSDDEEF